jgi:exonuclease III
MPLSLFFILSPILVPWASPRALRCFKIAIMNCTRKISIVSWNVRGLGEDDKCISVRDVFATCRPAIALVQETKVRDVSSQKIKSFLPANLSAHCFLAADGSRGGIVTAWDKTHLALVSSHSRLYTLTTVLSFAATDLHITITNVYGPSYHNYTASFLDELRDLSTSVTGPWLMAGDFNLIRDASEKITTTSMPPEQLHSMLLSMICRCWSSLFLITYILGLTFERVRCWPA